MIYDITKTTPPEIPTLGNGLETQRLLLSQTSKDMFQPEHPCFTHLWGRKSRVQSSSTRAANGSNHVVRYGLCVHTGSVLVCTFSSLAAMLAASSTFTVSVNRVFSLVFTASCRSSSAILIACWLLSSASRINSSIVKSIIHSSYKF